MSTPEPGNGSATVNMLLSGEPTVNIYGQDFRLSGQLQPWLIMKLAQAERRNDIDAAMARFADLIESAVHPDDLERLDQHLSTAKGVTFAGLQEAIGKLMMAAGQQAGMSEVEAEDPTERPSSGPSTVPATADTSEADWSWQGDPGVPFPIRS